MEFRQLTVVEYEDPGCPEENCPPSTELAFVGTQRDAEAFIQRMAGDFRGSHLRMTPRWALVVEPDDYSTGAVIFVDAVTMGPQIGWKNP